MLNLTSENLNFSEIDKDLLLRIREFSKGFLDDEKYLQNIRIYVEQILKILRIIDSKEKLGETFPDKLDIEGMISRTEYILTFLLKGYELQARDLEFIVDIMKLFTKILEDNKNYNPIFSQIIQFVGSLIPEKLKIKNS